MQKVSLLLLVVFATPSFSQNQIEALQNPGVTSAVQSRAFRLKHELNLSVGALPLDAFYKAFTAQVGYAYHFSDVLAWQVGRGAFAYRTQTNLRQELERRFGVSATPTEQVEFFLGSDILYSPLYGKLAVVNQSLVFGQAFLVLGGTVFKFTNSFRPAANVGGGFRIFVSQLASVRLQFDNHVVIPTGAGATNFLHIFSVNLTLGVNFGGGEP